MKTTGIVRRIDELGRVVIPKEIRRTMRIKEGEEMEVSIGDEDSLVLKKYSPVKNLIKTAWEYADVLGGNACYPCLLCDNDVFIAASGKKEIYVGNRISKALENFLRTRRSAYLRGEEAFDVCPGVPNGDLVVSPVLVGGDVVGGVVFIADKTMSGGDNLVRMATVGAGFLAKQIE